MFDRLTKVLWWVLAGLLFGSAVATSMLISKEVEQEYFPVITNAQITKVQIDGDGILVWGSFDKVRDCKFVEAAVASGPARLELEFKDVAKYRVATRPIGAQVFGPWRISPAIYPLRIYTRHQCHPLWLTTTAVITDYRP